MKVSLKDVFDLLGVDSFTPKTFKAKTPGMVRDYHTVKRDDGRSFFLMSNEFKLDAQGKKVGAPDPTKPIYCVLMPDETGEHTWVIQYSNKEGASSLAKEETTYSRQ